MVARKKPAAEDLKELVDWLKANPDKASATSVGTGEHGAVLRHGIPEGDRHQLPVRAVSRRRAGAATIWSAGQIDCQCDLAANSLAQYRAGNIKAYAVMTKARWFAAPEVPTADEAGVPGLYLQHLARHLGAEGHPADVVAKINAAANAAMADPEVRKRIADARHGPAAAGAADARGVRAPSTRPRSRSGTRSSRRRA